MSDGSLTQDEIDALLQGSANFDVGGESPDAGGGTLSDAEKAAMQSILQSTTGSQASNLSLLVTKGAKFGPPRADIMDRDALAAASDDEVVQVSLNFSDGLLGEHSYILPRGLATAIAGLMMGQDELELNEAALSAIQEAVSQVSGPVLTVLGDKTKSMVMTDPAEALLVAKEDIVCPDGDFLVITYPLAIEGVEPADLLEVYTLQQASEIASRGGVQTPAEKPAPRTAPKSGPKMPGPGLGAMMGQGMGMNTPNVQPVQFPNLNSGQASSEHGNISLLMDVYMEMTVELGRTRKLIKEILGMGEGTIIELDKLAGEPVDILVNHKLIAKGEVVVIDENFGVRVTEIVSPMERMKDLT